MFGIQMHLLSSTWLPRLLILPSASFITLISPFSPVSQFPPFPADQLFHCSPQTCIVSSTENFFIKVRSSCDAFPLIYAHAILSAIL